MSLHAQDKSNKGKEFWLGYGYMYSFNNEAPVNTQQLVLYLSAEEAANVTVSVNGTGWSQSVSVPAHTVNATITVPKSGPDDARIFNEGLFNRGIHIVSDTPIVVYAHVYNSMVSGATMLMPVETYGYKYFSLNYAQNTSAFMPPGATATVTQNGPDWYSWFYVVASEDNTRILITPSDTTRNGWLPGQTYTVNLNRGEIYNVMGKLIPNNNALYAASKDMTGSKVVSVPGNDGTCHPVAMFSGSSGIRLCRGDGGEYMQQQVFPTQAWGTRYLTYHTMNNTVTNINDGFKNFYRIAVNDPTTIVKRNGVVMTGLINNFYYEYLDSLGGDYIEADKPILLAQYTPGGNRCYNMSQFAYGDPEMFYLSALEQGKKDVLFYATRNANIDYNYLNVIVPTAGLASLQLDGSPFLAQNIIPHPHHAGYSVAVARMLGPAAQHRLTCDSAFVATVYGLGFFESYGYNVGTFINNLNSFSSIKNTYSALQVDTVTCPKTPVRLFVKVGYQATYITWKLSQVPGISPNVDSLVLNPIPVATESINGRTYYTYTLQQDFSFAATGTYEVPVTYTASVIENCSQTEKASVKVVVKPGPAADFTVSSNLCLGDSVHFQGNPSANGFNLVSYNWLFDDNSTVNGLNAVKKFNSAGNHTVRFRVFADNGCAGDTTKPVAILESPLAKFGVQAQACTGNAILFTDSSSISTGSITTRTWIFGDGNSITQNNNNPVNHAYSTPGTYTVSLVVLSSNGCKSDTARRTVSILPKPVAKFGYDKDICLGDSIRFTDSSAIAVGTITSWSWNFGDGNSASYTSNQPFYHHYTGVGVYTVALAVQSNNGCVSDTFKTNVRVNNKPAATFTMDGRPCVDSAFSFVSSLSFSGSNPGQYYWSFGDGQTLLSNSSNSATHVYNTSLANVVVKHMVSYGPGCSSDTAMQTIPLIQPAPVAQFAIDPSVICAGEAVQFSSSLPAGNLAWNWNFGNGTGTTPAPFSRTYTTAGTYTIGLIVRTPQGCSSAPVNTQLTVRPAPPVHAGADKFISKGSSVQLDASIANPADYNFSWTPATYLNNPTLLNPMSTPDTTILYVITATDKLTGCENSDTVRVQVIYELYIPNAFTPNGDGLNDTWVIPGLALYPEAKVTIFNRWGQPVYATKNYYSRPWNGLVNGKKQPNDTFVYQIEMPAPKAQVIKGTVTIVR